MNGITIPKKRLNDKQIIKAKSFVVKYPTLLEGYLYLAQNASVGVTTVQKAIAGKELSVQVIDKIIAAL